MKAYSVLDLAPIIEGGDAGLAFRNTLDLARHAEQWGYHRYWLAEHHNMEGIASAATSVVIGFVAGGTSRIRVGSGGVMLSNHAPLVIAEQFGTLESLYPGRIDLGLGRAPGGDQLTARALRRNLGSSGDTFPEDVLELQNYFREFEEGDKVRAFPGESLHVPLYLLGSSDFSARLAAALGLPFAFASHFAPEHLQAALKLYRENYRPSERNPVPYVMVGLNIFAAENDAEGGRLFTSLEQQFLGLIRGARGRLQAPVDPADLRISPAERTHLQRMTRYSLIGSADTIRAGLTEVLQETQADEIIATGQIHDHGARLLSFEIFAGVAKERWDG